LRIVFYSFATGAYNQEWTHYHWEDELRRGGHTVDTINPYGRGHGLRRGEYDQFVVDKVAAEHNREPISLFFASVRDHEMSADAVQLIRGHGIRTVNANYDDILVPHRAKAIASAFDLCWVHEPEAVDTYRRYGARVFHAPVAANPHFYRPSFVSEDVDVSFCGARYGSRIAYVEELFRRDIPVELHGVGWRPAEESGNPGSQQRRLPHWALVRHVAGSLTHKYGRTWVRASVLRRLKRRRTAPGVRQAIRSHAHPPLSFPDMVELFSRSKLSMGFNELGHTYVLKQPLLQVRLRDFEAPMSGACYIMYRMPIMQEHFEEDKEMLFYSSAEELADKIRFYLDPRRDSARAEIKQWARVRAVRDHTWVHRFSRLFKELGLA